MKELIEILDAIDRFAAAREPMALATIVGVRGSTYRRQGARLLLTRSQQMVGNISGGCLEGDVMVVADEVMTSGQARLVTYDLTADDDVVWGLGLGCNGAVDIFVEPVDPSAEIFTLYRKAIAEERALAAVTVLSGGGRRCGRTARESGRLATRRWMTGRLGPGRPRSRKGSHASSACRDRLVRSRRLWRYCGRRFASSSVAPDTMRFQSSSLPPRWAGGWSLLIPGNGSSPGIDSRGRGSSSKPTPRPRPTACPWTTGPTW